jgi:glutathione S-transferase
MAHCKLASTGVAESGAIVEYLVDRYGKGRLKPAHGTPEQRRYTYWLHYAEGSAMPPLLMSLVFSRIPKRAPALPRPLVRKVTTSADRAINPQPSSTWHTGKRTGKNEWFAGSEFSAADIQMSFPLERRCAAGSSRVTPGRWLRPYSRPAGLQARAEKDGPYTEGNGVADLARRHGR